jgi:hypothetical protein
MEEQVKNKRATGRERKRESRNLRERQENIYTTHSQQVVTEFL